MALILGFFCFGAAFHLAVAQSNKTLLCIATTAFKAYPYDKEANLQKIEAFMLKAKEQGAEFIVFPEMALVGYGSDKQRVRELAEPIPGPSTERIGNLGELLNIWVVMGMPEYDPKTGQLYDSAAIVEPFGDTLAFRKLHTVSSEPTWASEGDTPLVFPSPWGPIGIAICQDNYVYPGVIRYSARNQAKVHLSPTAYSGAVLIDSPQIDDLFRRLYFNLLFSWSKVNGVYLVSANHVGGNFIGESLIVGPDRFGSPKVYAGPSGQKEGVFTACLNLNP